MDRTVAACAGGALIWAGTYLAARTQIDLRRVDGIGAWARAGGIEYFANRVFLSGDYADRIDCAARGQRFFVVEDGTSRKELLARAGEDGPDSG